QFYEQAIRGAQENQFVHDQALANELFAQFWLEQGNDRIAEMYMREARTLYHQWGARAKVDHLDQRFPHWFQAKPTFEGDDDPPRSADSKTTTITQPKTSIQSDLESITSASQLLSAETDLELLITKMMSLVMANSGADKGILLLRQENGWFVQARSDIKSDQHDILLNQPFDASDRNFETDFVPEAVFHYCHRSKEVLVVENAQLDPRFTNDKMIQSQSVKSITCIPILAQGRLRAVLYLENRQMTDVFTTERVGILRHLSAQFGSSMENALLYNNLTEKIGELEVSEARFRATFEQAAVGIAHVSPEGQFLRINQKFCDIVGYTRDEMLRRTFQDITHPDDLDADLNHVQRLLAGESDTYTMNKRYFRKDGETVWVNLTVSLLREPDEKPKWFVSVVEDITERKQIEEEREQSEERFRSLMEASPLAIEILTPNGQISQVNAAWMSLWGVNEEETAQTLATYNMLNDEQLDDLGLAPVVKRAFSGQHVVLPPILYDANRTAQELGFELIEGRSPWIQSHLYAVKDASGEVDYVVNIYMDITELKRTEQEAQVQREALARVDRTTSMGQLTGSISHELNQPLTGILSNAQAAEMMLESGHWEKEEISEIMADIVADAKRAGDVIRNLRQLFRKQRVEFLPVDINAIVEETTKLLHSEFIIRRVLLTTQYDSSLPWVNGNRIQIQQVLVNLIMNASQAMKNMAGEDRRIHIATTYDAGEVKVY
ncbi:MAG: PAS domain S-box protein, partial [Anaerolineaceae bacterium]